MKEFSLYQFIDQALKLSEEIGVLDLKIHEKSKQENELKSSIEKSKQELLALKRESLETAHKIEEKEFDIDEFFQRENKEKTFIDEHMSSHVRVLAQKSLQAIQNERLQAEQELAQLYALDEKQAPKFKALLEIQTKDLEAQEHGLNAHKQEFQDLKTQEANVVEQLKQLAQTIPDDIFKKLFHNGDFRKLTVARVISQLCSKCYYPLSSLQYNTLLRQDTDLVECKNCFVSLYINKNATP